jgi:hypothetical protein
MTTRSIMEQVYYIIIDNDRTDWVWENTDPWGWTETELGDVQ